MRRTLIVAIALHFLVGGCRTASRPYMAESLTQRYSPASLSLPNDDPESQRTIADRRGPAPVSVQTVAHQRQPSAVQENAATESLPGPNIRHLAKSSLALPDLEGIALQNSPVLAQSAARIDAARGSWVQAGIAPNPVFGYSGQQLGSRGLAEQQGVYIGQEVITGKKLTLDRQVAAWEIQRLENEFAAYRMRVLTDVRIGYYEVLVAQQRRELTIELVRLSERAVKAAEALFKSEEVSEADPLRARVDADSARILLQNSINQHVEAWRRLTAVLGMPEMKLERLAGELKPERLNITWQDELRRLLSESPEIAAAIADIEVARWAVQRAYAEVIPNVEVQAVIQDDRGTGSTNGNLQVSMPIPLWNRNQGGVQRAHAEAAAAQQAVDRLALDLQSRLATAFQRYDSARNQATQYSKPAGIIANSKRTLDLIRAGYEAEEFGVLELLAAQRTYFRTRLAHLDSLRALALAVMEIRGMLLQGSLAK